MPPTLTRRQLLAALPAATSAAPPAFADTVGVNTHLASPPYARDPATLLDRIQALGIRHLRDELRPDNDWPRWRRLAEAARLRFTLLVSPATNTPAQMLDAIATLGPRHVAAIEGQNEGDSPWFRAQPAAGAHWADTVCAYQRATAAALRRAGLPIPLLSPTVLDYRPADMALLRPAAPDSDVVALHAYPQGDLPPETDAPYAALAWYAREFADRFKPGAPIIVTETGYATTEPGLPPATAARYLPRLLLWNAAAGIRRTFLYELLDEGPDPADPEQNYGLLTPDLHPKPAFETIRLLLAADPAAPTPAPTRIPGLHALSLGPRLAAVWRSTTEDGPAPIPFPTPIAILRLAPGETWRPPPPELAVTDTVTLLHLPSAR